MDADFGDEQDAFTVFEEETWADSIDDPYAEESSFEIPDDYFSINLINNQDYNLNSPILPHNIDSLSSFLTTGDCEKIFFKPEYNDIKETISSLNYDPFKFKNKYNDAIKFLSMIRLTLERTDRADALLKNIGDDIGDVGLVLKTFIAQWLQKDLIDLNKIKYKLKSIDKYTRSILNLFLHYHTLVIIANTNSNIEAKSVSKKFNATLLKKGSHIIGWLYKSSLYGKVLITSTFCIYLDHEIILDKNFLLMAKDVCVGRSQTLISMQILDSEYEFSMQEVQALENLYRLGDEMIVNLGNDSYDGVKLIEPICNKWMCEKSFEFRPMMPKFESFSNHVVNAVDELQQSGNLWIQDLYRKIMDIQHINLILVVYGSFRHWGHPCIDVSKGLSDLRTLVNEYHPIDDSYAQSLASDLAYKVLKSEFDKKKKWFVNIDEVDPKCLLYDHIKNHTWPTRGVIQEFGDNWHKLPLVQCYELQDIVEPSLLYSDKSHSMTRTQVFSHIQNNAFTPIPTKRVLKTLLETEAVDWPAFLKKIDEEGLDEDDLIIGLKPKERELKKAGRYFSLMSWNLRNYFVYTEHLIKTHYLKLFKGITMADDLNTLIKKMLDSSSGHGLSGYDQLTISNCLDYTKWNNYQRMDSNKYVFEIMGKFLGYPNLFKRTHEFFEKSIIYYPSRPDLMFIDGGLLYNKTDQVVCWNGQLGGLEGLRQKGWSVVSYLMIERESRIRNTSVKVLAQGDNQVVNTRYKTKPYLSDQELVNHLTEIKHNNKVIMDAITDGAHKLGLIINKDETMQSIDYFNYGKVVIYRGKILGLSTKRWSRNTCCSNDQTPSLGTILSSGATNALTVANFNETPIDGMTGHLVFGLFSLELLNIHNPAIRGSPQLYIKNSDLLDHWLFKVFMLYNDPSLGGIGGTCLNRFLIRNFPDSVTESLSFWKVIYTGTNNQLLKNLCVKIGNPNLARFQEDHVNKLIEKPESLNIPKGISAMNMIKEQIKHNMYTSSYNIKNEVIRDATIQAKNQEVELFAWLRHITPLFPRFLSEMSSATYYGMVQSIVGLFTNSRTLRNTFKSKCIKDVDKLILKSEIIGISHGVRIVKSVLTSNFTLNIWDCSSSHADTLREISWGAKVLGTTVPHPIEMLSWDNSEHNQCNTCEIDGSDRVYVTVLTPYGVPSTNYEEIRGPYPPYLGSKTNESTSLIQPWEKETNVPIIKKAAKLRDAIHWFIDPNSKLAKSILNNLFALTGEDWSLSISGFERTGSALHRFSCSRVNSGGFLSVSPTRSSWLIVTTDTMKDLGDENFDFMYQALILYAQITVGSVPNNKHYRSHLHIKCKSCLRPIEEPKLDSAWEYNPPIVFDLLNKWKPNEDTKWGTQKLIAPNLQCNSDWMSVSNERKCFYIGLIIGFVYTDQILSKQEVVTPGSLFPISIKNKLEPRPFFVGLAKGIKIAVSVNLTHRRNIIIGNKVNMVVDGAIYYVLDQISQSSHFLQFVNNGNLYDEINSVPHKIPPSYPLSPMDLGSVSRSYLKRIFKTKDVTDPVFEVWVFSDIRTTEVLGTIGIGLIAERILSSNKLNKQGVTRIKELQEDYIKLLNNDLIPEKLSYYVRPIRYCSSEIRHTCKFNLDVPNKIQNRFDNFTNPDIGVINIVDVLFIKKVSREGTRSSLENTEITQNQQRQVISDHPSNDRNYLVNPSISGLRLFQCATGAHYKIYSIIKSLGINPNLCLIGGDGSGGISSLILRTYKRTKVIFNSLLSAEGHNFHGAKPSKPSAIVANISCRDRCINLDHAWEEPNDLRTLDCWTNFKKYLEKEGKLLDLAVFDMEVTDDKSIKMIEYLLLKLLPMYMNENSVLIYKTYYPRMINEKFAFISNLGRIFKTVEVCNTSFTSSFSTELYVICKDLNQIKRENLELDPNCICKIKTLVDQMNDVKHEFARVVSLSENEDLLTGIPKELLSDPYLDFGTCLTIIGVEGGVVCSLNNHLETSNINGFLTILLFIHGLILNNLIGCTKPMNHIDDIPSDQILSLSLSFWWSLQNWVSIKSKSVSVFGKLHALLNSSSKIVYFTLITIQGRNKLKILIKKRRPPQFIASKETCLRNKMALLGQLTRCIERMYRDKKIRQKNFENKINNQVWKQLSQEFNHRLTPKLTSLLFEATLEEFDY